LGRNGAGRRPVCARAHAYARAVWAAVGGCAGVAERRVVYLRGGRPLQRGPTIRSS
jgi:hypothetical protein